MCPQVRFPVQATSSSIRDEFFDEDNVYLSVSGQLHLEAMVRFVFFLSHRRYDFSFFIELKLNPVSSLSKPRRTSLNAVWRPAHRLLA